MNVTVCLSFHRSMVLFLTDTIDDLWEGRCSWLCIPRFQGLVAYKRGRGNKHKKGGAYFSLNRNIIHLLIYLLTYDLGQKRDNLAIDSDRHVQTPPVTVSTPCHKPISPMPVFAPFAMISMIWFNTEKLFYQGFGSPNKSSEKRLLKSDVKVRECIRYHDT